MSNMRRKTGRPGEEKLSKLEFFTEDSVEEEQKFEEVFSIDGKPYYLWVNPPPNIGLDYLARVKEGGTEAAIVWLLEQMIGEDGYKALRTYKGLKRKQLSQVIQICKDYSIGDDEDDITGN